MRFLKSAAFAGMLILLPYQIYASPPDFKKMSNVTQRKKAFFDYLLPLVRMANANILKVRQQLLEYHRLAKQRALDAQQQQQVDKIAKRYKIKSFDTNSESDWQQLLSRVDVIPASLVLAQAATESAWGTSRFARQANNFFGQWCYTQGCGMIPRQRSKGSRHEVRTFASVLASVQSYLYNLNTNRNYKQLRNLRYKARSLSINFTGSQLAEGLLYYSQRRGAYVESIKKIIGSNHLGQYDKASSIA